MSIFQNEDYITDMANGLNTQTVLSTIKSWFETGLYFYFMCDNGPSILNNSYKRNDKIKFISDGQYIAENIKQLLTYNIISDNLVVHGFYYKKKKQYFPVVVVSKRDDVVVVLDISIESDSTATRLVGKAKIYELTDNGSLKITAHIAPIYNNDEPAYYMKINNFTQEEVEIIMKNKNNYLYTATTGNMNNKNEYMYRHQHVNGDIRNMELLSSNNEKIIQNCNNINDFKTLCKLHDINLKNYEVNKLVHAAMNMVDSHMDVSAVAIK